jgi:hypothetical protein
MATVFVSSSFLWAHSIVSFYEMRKFLYAVSARALRTGLPTEFPKASYLLIADARDRVSDVSQLGASAMRASVSMFESLN